ncbi:hypothetical protein, partial [Herbaspirillum sp. B65]|uniref:hypothetical protein n=1 Tax=Herbaspirillum sp. B65 TaxID=137708 RepID=UPI0018FF4A5C
VRPGGPGRWHTPSTVGLINSGLKALGTDALAALNLSQVQIMATAAAKLRNLASASSIMADAKRPAADAVNPDGTPQAGAPLTYDEFHALGMAVNNAPANLKLLNEVFNARPNFASVSDLGKINALNLVDIVNRVMRQADADVKPADAPAGITVAELTTLGLSSTGATPDVNARFGRMPHIMSPAGKAGSTAGQGAWEPVVRSLQRDG